MQEPLLMDSASMSGRDVSESSSMSERSDILAFDAHMQSRTSPASNVSPAVS